MSIHSKIVWLFIGVAVVPLLILAGFSHRQTLAAVGRATEVRLLEDVTSVSGVITRESETADGALRLVASVLLSDTASSSALLSRALEEERSDQWFEYLELVDAADSVLATAGRAPFPPVRCGPRGRTTLVKAEVPLGEDGRRLVGSYWIGQTLGIEGVPGMAVFDRGGRLLYSSTCDGTAVALAGSVGAGRDTVGVVQAEGEGEPRYVAYAPVGDGPWTAVVIASSTLRAPVARMFTTYWLFVLSLSIATVLAFSMLLRRVTRSIRDLTRAAERIGEGDLFPWLPPPGPDEVGRLTLAFSMMTSRLRDTLDQVDRSGRLSVLGQLASYLAHEIRNPLSSVKMNIQRLQRWEQLGDLPDKTREPLEISLKEVDRLSMAVNNVLQLSRPQEQAAEVVSMHELVTEAGQLLDNEFVRRSVSLQWDLDASADRILGRPGQIKGVIINLMLNALDAQPGGGALFIRSSLAPGPRGGTGPWLELRFKDRGPGVPAEIRDRIFEPFFTTKQSGSGIGLAVAAQAVSDNGGELYLEDPHRIGQGAEFVMRFPLAAVSPDGPSKVEGARLAPWMEGAPPESEPLVG